MIGIRIVFELWSNNLSYGLYNSYAKARMKASELVERKRIVSENWEIRTQAL